MKYFVRLGAALLALTLLAACSKDEKSSAERDKEVQKVLQEGAQKEQKMYEGMQKSVENLEKQGQQKEETKK
jgi:outer membrane protein assembly factor BamE (lipoprotein component of BamABCDE complex)